MKYKALPISLSTYTRPPPTTQHNMKSALFLCLSAVSINALVLPLQLNLGGGKTPSLRSIATCRKLIKLAIKTFLTDL